MGEDIRNQAFEDYKKGMKYKDIAEKYGVSLSAVKSWATRYWKRESCNQAEKKLQPKKRKVATRGAQPNNRNAAGHGGTGPPGNKNALKTGEFEALFFNTLEPEERRLIVAMPTDKESLLLHEIQLLTVREKRMLQRIEDVRTAAESGKDGESVPGMTIVKRQSGIDKDKETDLKEYQGKLGQIQAIEDALTRVQARKQKAIDSLHRFGFDEARLEMELLKLEIMSAKLGGQDTDPADDGFLDALNAEAGALWGDIDGD
nr:phage terminase small subunit [uncultured Acetatifactor sp.]